MPLTFLILGFAIGLLASRLLKPNVPKFKTGDRVAASSKCTFNYGLGRVEHVYWRKFEKEWCYFVVWDSGGDGYYPAEKLKWN